MTKEEIEGKAMQEMASHKYIALEWPTGYGKTKGSIDLVNSTLTSQSSSTILLLVAKSVHKQNWKDEIDKWGGFKGKCTVVMECYESLRKHAGETFDYVIADECHHLNSDLRRDCFKSLKVNKKVVMLSATIPRDLKQWLRYQFHTSFVSTTLQSAVTDNVLPTPEIILLPLILDNKKETEMIEINARLKGKSAIGYYATDYWKFKKLKVHAKLKATPRQYLQWLNNEILYYKNSFMRLHSEPIKLKWLKLCSDRLKFLAEQKTSIVAQILYRKRDCRTLTFCNNIEQAEELGTHCIHSKNIKAERLIDSFNKKKINHITAVQMLNEGVNLTDCQYGIFANINASQVITTQRIGRILRHKQPKLIIPFYKDTREEELVKKMIEGYDKKLIKTYENIEKLL